MQVTDKYAVDFLDRYSKAFQLHLYALTGINKKVPVLDFQIMGGRKPAIGG